ncbi:hypothetical protein [Pseudomonas sp. DWP3-1-2]|uniref:hypothetical protein n=1 Tax=Pseudomonas sp. DWP3-1-2 TaxID=2804645 RepID=UPI003CEC1CC0
MSLLRWLNGSFRRCCLVWGIFDGLFIFLYCLVSVMSDHVPYFYEFQLLQMFWGQPYSQSDWQFLAVPIATALWVFNVSIILSFILFLSGSRRVRYLIFAQLPFRLVGVIVLGTAVVASKTITVKVALTFVMVFFVVAEMIRFISLVSTHKSPV